MVEKSALGRRATCGNKAKGVFITGKEIDMFVDESVCDVKFIGGPIDGRSRSIELVLRRSTNE